jgi:hypothetical protein
VVACGAKEHQAQGRGFELRPLLGHLLGRKEPVVQPATALTPETEGEEGVVWSGHVLFGSYLT